MDDNQAPKDQIASGMNAGAVVAGVIAAVLLSFALIYALATMMHIGWAALIVAIIWAMVALVLQVEAHRWLKSPPDTGAKARSSSENGQPAVWSAQSNR